MAEPTDHVQRLPAAPPPTDQPSSLHAPTADNADNVEPYRSLSLLALLGFGLAAIYAAIIVVVGIVALFSGKPMDMPLWTLFFPVLAAFLSLVARLQILRSEDTLAGAKLTTWGLGLSVLVFVMYWSYYLAVRLAVQQQATQFADRWIEFIQNEELARAMLYTMPPDERVGIQDDSPALATTLDIRMRGRRQANPVQSPLLSFMQMEFVRRIQGGGADTKVLSRGLKDWSYTKGGYQVVLVYRLSTPEASFDAFITVHGKEAEHKEYEGRQWQVELGGVGVDNVQLTELGQNVARVGRDGARFVEKWQRKVLLQQTQEGFLDTLPASERAAADQLLNQHQAALGAKAESIGLLVGATGVPGPVAPSPVWKQYQSYLAGDLVNNNPDRFWGEQQNKDRILKTIQEGFTPQKNLPPMRLEMGRSQPTRSREGDRIRLHFDVSLSQVQRTPEMKEPPMIMTDGVLIIEADARIMESPEVAPHWRVVKILLHSGRTVQPGQEQPPPPG